MKNKLYDLVGFDYAAALRAILQSMTYDEVAQRIGYKSTGGVSEILKGRIPSHRHGEAIYALYRELFKVNPPMSRTQATGVATAE